MAAPMLALESGEKKAEPNLVTMGVLVLCVSLLVGFGALLGAWLSLRSGTLVWPPKGVTLENYYGTTLSITMILAVLAAVWLLYAVLKQDRAQAVGASVLLVLFGLAFVNLQSYVVHVSHFGPATHAYGAVYFAFNILMGASVVTALVLAVVTLVRFLGGQVSAREPALAWSAMWFWLTTGLGWGVMYFTVYVVK